MLSGTLNSYVTVVYISVLSLYCVGWNVINEQMLYLEKLPHSRGKNYLDMRN